jgi:Tfp pilus assembly protein PilE
MRRGFLLMELLISIIILLIGAGFIFGAYYNFSNLVSHLHYRSVALNLLRNAVEFGEADFVLSKCEFVYEYDPVNKRYGYYDSLNQRWGGRCTTCCDRRNTVSCVYNSTTRENSCACTNCCKMCQDEGHFFGSQKRKQFPCPDSKPPLCSNVQQVSCCVDPFQRFGDILSRKLVPKSDPESVRIVYRGTVSNTMPDGTVIPCRNKGWTMQDGEVGEGDAIRDYTHIGQCFNYYTINVKMTWKDQDRNYTEELSVAPVGFAMTQGLALAIGDFTEEPKSGSVAAP